MSEPADRNKCTRFSAFFSNNNHGESLPLLVGLKPLTLGLIEPAPLTLSKIHEEKALLLWKADSISGEYFYLL